ncbi:hypothetical protein BGX20_006008, partial [Mortierella sp. AD010]
SVKLDFDGYGVMSRQRLSLGEGYEKVLCRGYEGYPRFDFMVGRTFIQVSISDFAKHQQTSDIAKAFTEKFPKKTDLKNQIAGYLDDLFGGDHKAKIVDGSFDVTKKSTKSGKYEPVTDFTVLYIHGREFELNHTKLVKKFKDVKAFCVPDPSDEENEFSGLQHTAETAQEDPAIEALRRELAAVSLELRNTQLDLKDVEDDLEFIQAERDTALSSLAETQLELQNARDALANSEYARREANQNRVISRPCKEQEVFVVLKFQKPQPPPVGGFRIFAQQRKVVDRRLKQFIADNPELDAVEVEELRFDRSPRGENVIQHMRRDKDAPIKLSRRNFILKDGKMEDEMVEYITQVYNTHTQEN